MWGAGVIDADYRGELGILLFNFGDNDFVVNAGDRIAQLILEKIKTPEIKESISLGETGRGGDGFGSTGINAADKKNEYEDEKPVKSMNVANPITQSKQLITARQMQKLAKADQPIYLAIVRSTNEAPRVCQRSNKTPTRVAQFAAAHGQSQINKRSVSKMTGPKKDIISVAQRESEVISQVPVVHRGKLEKIIHEYRDIFPEQLPKGIPPPRVVEHAINVEPGSKPSYRPPIPVGSC